MPTPSQPFVEPEFMTNVEARVIPAYDRNFDSSALGNDNGAKSPTTGQTFPTGK
jgi:hypothetical protein